MKFADFASKMLLILLFGTIASCLGAITESLFTLPCVNEPDCLKHRLQASLPTFLKAHPQIGLESLDPFHIDKLELLLPGGLVMNFREGSAKGLKSCIIDSARLVGDVMHLQLHCNLLIVGKYKSTGRLLLFSIDGDGDSAIKCKNIKLQFAVKLGTVIGEDGLTHLEIINVKTKHSFEGQVRYRMTNLLKGSPQLSQVILNFMNQNWRLVAEEFGSPIVDFGVQSVLKNLKKLLKAVPLDLLIKD